MIISRCQIAPSITGSVGDTPTLRFAARQAKGSSLYSARATGRGLLNFRADMRRFLKRLGFQMQKPSFGRVTLGDAVIESISAKRDKDPFAVGAFTIKEVIPRPVAVLAPPQTETKHVAPTTTQKEKTMTIKAEHDGRQTFNHGEVAKMTMLIMQYATVDPVNKTVNYHPAWSDERVLAHIATGDRRHLQVDGVIKFRKATFDRTPEEIKRANEGRAAGGLGAMWSSIKDLERRVAALEDSATSPKNGAGN